MEFPSPDPDAETLGANRALNVDAGPRGCPQRRGLGSERTRKAMGLLETSQAWATASRSFSTLKAKGGLEPAPAGPGLPKTHSF